MKTIINQNQIGILIHEGRVARTLSAGVYRTHRFRNESVVVYPLHPQMQGFVLNIRTADAAAVSAEITVKMIIKDAVKLYISGNIAAEIVQQSIACQLQQQAGAKSLSELLESGLSVDETLLDTELAEFGLTVTVMLSPRIKLPRNLQNAIDAQEVARQRAKSELEEARGRSAVIRHYANVAKITKDNPDLLRLLLGQKAKSINVAFDATGRSSK